MTEAELGSGNLICAVAFDGGWCSRTETQGYGRLVRSLYLLIKSLPRRGPVPTIKLHISLHVYVNYLVIFYSLISLLDPTKPIHTPKLLALCLARARFLDKLILLAVICTYAGTLYTIHADVYKHPMIFCSLRIIWISFTTTVDSAFILTQIADCFIIQITSDLPKSGVNTGPLVSEYEKFMLRNSVNPMPQSA